MQGVFCVHFSQFIDHCVIRHTTHEGVEQTYAKILVNPCERQVSWVTLNDEVVDH